MLSLDSAAISVATTSATAISVAAATISARTLDTTLRVVTSAALDGCGVGPCWAWSDDYAEYVGSVTTAKDDGAGMS